jgi:hypothetical protein
VHSFTVRVTTLNGRQAIDRVRAAVVAAPSPPSQLTGTWQRTVTPADLRKATSSQPPPPGLWKLHINSIGWQLTDPQNGRLTFDVEYMSATTLQMRPTIEIPPNPQRAPNIGAEGFCKDTDLLFNWTAQAASDDKRMRLDPQGKDPCGDRIAILQGTWTRAGS